MNLIVISNRVAPLHAEAPLEGGLAAALLPAVKTGGAIWVGANTRLLDARAKEPLAEVETVGSGVVARVDLPAGPYRGFYEGFANSALWPMLHSRVDLIRTGSDDYAAYRAINAMMARAVVRFSTSQSIYWVHDYHFVPLGAELRRAGVTQPIGFFLHTPFPERSAVAGLPHHKDLFEAMLAYDLIGFQTNQDLANFSAYVEQELGLRTAGNLITAGEGSTRLGTFPIGIDAAAFAEEAAKSSAWPEVLRLRSSLNGAKLAIGVDRLDYSKGLANRFRAFDRMLATDSSLKRTVSLLQIAVPSRTQVDSYRQLRAELAVLVGEINGRHGEADWTPIRYLNRAFPQSILAGFYRAAHVGLITSLHDGMNLVAKEYVAAQDPANPGVLVLSRFVGAAKQLDAALLVNPHDVDGLARCIAEAFAMPLEERHQRWAAMIHALEASSLKAWFAAFVGELEGCPPRAGQPAVRRVALADSRR